jgi:N6-adenosine-specific RNA methylase IME4
MLVDSTAAELEPHPFAAIFPILEGDDLAALVADIKANGLQNPIVLCDGEILDGRNRYLACAKAGVPIRTENYGGSDPLSFVISVNLRRRHLNESQRAMVAAQLATLRRGSNQHASIEASSQSGAADLMKVSRSAVQRARNVRKKAIPKLRRRVERGEVSVSLAEKVARLPIEDQDKLAAADEGTLRSVVRTSTRVKREVEVAEKIEQVSQSLGAKLYGVIYADPPWSSDDASSISRICTMKLPAADDCVLFLWASMPRLADALRVLEAWGFTYKSHFVWAKTTTEDGFGLRIQHELLLIGVRGEVPEPSARENCSFLGVEAGPGSIKPDAFAVIIESLFPTLPKIELFARASRKGWDVTTDEAEGDQQGASLAEGDLEGRSDADPQVVTETHGELSVDQRNR